MLPPDPKLPLEAPTVPIKQLGVVESASQIAPSPPTVIDVGSLLAGRYQLTEILGEGGTGRVYKALDQQPATSGDAATVIAIKVLAPTFTEPAGRFAALTGQVNRLRRLVHPNIVRLFACERVGSVAFISMEYLPGESTYAMLHRRTVGSPVPLEAHEARLILAAVGDALEYAHGQGVLHGDLKPGNVMVTRGSGIKVIDFGMTRWLARPDAPDLEAPGPLAATPQYASPQLIGGEEPQAADDVFSLACLAYELLTGVHPFDGEAAGRTRSAPPQRPGLAPFEYAALVHALQGDRDKRSASVREFMAEFAPPPMRPAKSRWPLYAAVAAAAIVGVYLWTQYNASAPLPPVASAVQAPTAMQAPAPVVPAMPEPAPAPLSGTVKAGAIIHDCSTCPSMTVLPAGEFQQGAADAERDALPLEKPQHRVHVAYLLAMSTADITVDDFGRFAEATGRSMKGCDTYDGDWRHHRAASWRDPGFTQTARHPVVCASWNDALAYAGWLSRQTGHKYRLPSASEWEYAARAGGSAKLPWASDLAGACANANVADRSAEQHYPGWNVFPCDDGHVYTAPVESFKANAFGLSDMLGNVMVWTQDCWLPDYSNAPSDGSARDVPGCREHELRGGSWFSTPAVVKATYRNHFAADYRTSSVGIRLVREME